MDIKKIIGIILIAGAIALGYYGIQGLQKSEKSTEILGIELKAQDKGGKEKAYVQLGLAVVALSAGAYLVAAKKG